MFKVSNERGSVITQALLLYKFRGVRDYFISTLVSETFGGIGSIQPRPWSTRNLLEGFNMQIFLGIFHREVDLKQWLVRVIVGDLIQPQIVTASMIAYVYEAYRLLHGEVTNMNAIVSHDLPTF